VFTVLDEARRALHLRSTSQSGNCSGLEVGILGNPLQVATTDRQSANGFVRVAGFCRDEFCAQLAHYACS
jgi:hypothetical protein